MRLWTMLQRRLPGTIMTLFVAVTFVFLIIHLIPGDPVALILDENFSRDAYVALQHKLGLDQPLWRQYVDYMQSVLRGDWGMSFRTQRAVLPDLLAQFPYTIELAVAGILVAIMIGIPAGIAAAVYHNRIIDHISMVLALIGACMPSFWLGVLLMLVFALQLGWLPSIGVGSTGVLSRLSHLALPALAIGSRSAALIARMARSTMLDALGQDYVRTARAKGLRESAVLRRHALRNAMIPIATIVGLDLGGMLAGTTVIEIVFGRPGIGHMLIDAVLARDYPMIQGTLLFYVLVIILANMLVDVMYGVIDPRISSLA